jgi:hypothetical protein
MRKDNNMSLWLEMRIRKDEEEMAEALRSYKPSNSFIKNIIERNEKCKDCGGEVDCNPETERIVCKICGKELE